MNSCQYGMTTVADMLTFSVAIAHAADVTKHAPGVWLS